MKEEKKNKGFVQLIKFGLIGVLNTLIDLVVTMALNAVFGIYYLAKIVGYACGVLNSYVCNSRWTFKEEHKKNDAREMVLFLVVNVVTLGLSLLLQWVFRDKLHLDSWWIGFAGDNWLTNIVNGERFCLLISSGIALIVNFVGNKLFVFKKKSDEQ